MFEFEMIVAFGAGAALMAMAPVVRKMGNHELGDSMGQTGRNMAKSGVKVGIVAAGAAGKVVRGVAKSAAEVAESFVYLVEEAKTEAVSNDSVDDETKTDDAKKSSATITEVTVE
jgi:hypothetical protein